MKILAIIPAREGSKSIVHKNIQSLYGKPMIAYTILQALQSTEINRVIVSTDSAYYADIARSFGAEVPFLRPKEIAKDMSTDYEVFHHALTWLKENEQYEPEIVVHLRPTSPNRQDGDIDNVIRILKGNPQFDSVRSVTEHKETVFKMWFLKSNKLEAVVKSTQGVELYNQPRQNLEKTYLQNACIDVTRYATIMEKKSMTGTSIGAFLMDHFGDVDEWSDFKSVKRINPVDLVNKVFCVDIDGVIASLTPANDYTLAVPLIRNIEKINRLYAAGNRIVLFTARGTVTKIDWRQVTEAQLAQWGVLYHELKFEKPAADFYIDDRMLDLNDLEFN